MGIMNTVMDILRTLLIPVVAVVLAVVIFNMMKAPGKIGRASCRERV